MRVAALLLLLVSGGAVAQPQSSPDFIKKKDGTVLKGRVIRELERGLLFANDGGETIVVDYADIADAGHLTGPTAPAAPPPLVFEDEHGRQARRDRDELEDREEKQRRSGEKQVRIQAVRRAHRGLHLGITSSALWSFRTESSMPDVAAVATWGMKVLEVRASLGALFAFSTGRLDPSGGLQFGGMAIFQISRFITAGVGFRAGYLAGGLNTGFVGPVLQPLAVRFGQQKQFELALAAEVLFAPGRIYQTKADGILSYEQCVARANQFDAFCSSTGGVTLLPNVGIRVTYLFL